MHRKTSAESCERLNRLDTHNLQRQCARFVLDHASAIASDRPNIPTGLNDRAADIWEPLFVLADLAGGIFPAMARNASLALSAIAEVHNPIAELLLDIFCHFLLTRSNKVFSRSLVEYLNRESDGPWCEAKGGKGVTELWLSQQLRPYGIQPRTLWKDGTSARGYTKENFDSIFRRYVTKSDIEELKLRGSASPAKPAEPQPDGSLTPP